MDVSKLPKLSDTKGATADERPSPAPAEQASGAVPHWEPVPRPAGVGVDVWISTIVGLLCLSIGLPFAKFCVAKLTHQPFPTGYTWPDDDPKGRAGQEVAYFDLESHTAWGDMGVFLFGLTLLFEAASKTAVVLRPGSVSRGLLVLAVGLTVVTVGLNLYACILLQSVQITPVMSGLAVALGGWVLYDEWQTLRSPGRGAAVR